MPPIKKRLRGIKVADNKRNFSERSKDIGLEDILQRQRLMNEELLGATMTPEQALGQLKGFGRAIAVLPERAAGLPADMVELGRDAISFGVRHSPYALSLGKDKSEYNPEWVRRMDAAEIPWTSDKLIAKAREYNLAPAETDDLNVAIPETLADLALNFEAAPKLLMTGIKGITKAADKLKPIVKKTTIVTAEPAKFATGGAVLNAIKKLKTIERTKSALSPLVGDEQDIARSLASVSAYKKGVPVQAVNEALKNRAVLRAEPATTPGAAASEKEWADWGDKYGVNMTITPHVSLDVIDPKTGRPVLIPGGLEGKFTIPDLFAIKANNFDPSVLSRDQHNKLMQKFMRTHQIENPDAVDTFNALNFSLLSPNAPLTPNEFLQSRFRLKNMDELKDLAARYDEEGLSSALSKESGVGAASSGGLGIKGTALLGNQAELARLILAKPEMFKPAEGETLRDVTFRVMNQVPGLSQKTASLGVPWLDLEKGNTSAVDLHMIRNNWDKLLDDPQVGDAFVNRLSKLLKVDNTPKAIRAAAKEDPTKVEKKVISVIGQTKSQVYKSKKGDKLLGGANPVVEPSKLAYEPKKIVNFGPFYQRIVDYVDASRGENPVLPLFPEQWRLWDTYRGRVEPHEFAHPDYRKLPQQSFTEMQDALTAHKQAGYTSSAKEGKPTPSMKVSDWRKLYYGNADPLLLGGIGLTGGLGTLAYKYMNDDEESGD